MLSRKNFLERIGLIPLAFALPRTLAADESDDSPVENQLFGGRRNASSNYVPHYVALQQSGELKERGQALWERMEACDLCPRNCRTNRLEGERGQCRANSELEISSYGPHFGEEPELVGRHGSGTIFFTNCSLHCVFCINYDVSQLGQGRPRSISELADMMIKLQRRGCHNINVVTPTHYSPHILLALDDAASRGLRLPLAYNTCGWEKTEVLELLDGVVDIYLTDFKYGCPEKAGIYSVGAHTYVELTQQAHLKIQEQVGVAVPNADTGLMERGLILRHLVMPSDVSCTASVMDWIGEHLPKNTYVNLMSQYTPVFKAKDFPEINRRLYTHEYASAIASAEKAGLTNVHIQGY